MMFLQEITLDSTGAYFRNIFTIVFVGEKCCSVTGFVKQ